LIFLVCLLFNTSTNLNTLEETDTKPGALRTSVVLERQGIVMLVSVLPSYDSVALSLEVLVT